MKKRFLIVVLCLACVASFAQTKKKKAAAKKPAARQTARNVKPSSTVDTTKKIVDKPVVADAAIPKFDRPLDGYYRKTNIENNKVRPYTSVRESDVVFAKRVWEEIDVREKRNEFLASPKGRLIDVLMDAVAAGELTAYDPIPTKDDPNGDSFTTPLTPAKAKAKMADSVLVDFFDKKTGEKTGSKMTAGEFNPDSVVRFRIKEDWIFDKQRSVFEPRIIGIAPMIKEKVPGANVVLDY
ncbi:MAG TPA: hypothetical protein VL490_04830, partial [Mucilaginibacter sp.]|nr:hypothetical protein [Mucilaginibacter sp.]